MNNKFIEKASRIKYLSSTGYNTPRMLYIPIGLYRKNIININSFIKDFKYVNIRTYKLVDKNSESWWSKHYVQLPNTDVHGIISKINNEFVCMIDLEKPSDGILSGNIEVKRDGSCIQEFVYMPEGGAMVRLANRTSFGHICDKYIKLEVISDIDSKSSVQSWLRLIREQATKFSEFSKKDYILEWSIHKEKCGILGMRDIWWEYRNCT